jgi:hypothetical protein
MAQKVSKSQTKSPLPLRELREWNGLTLDQVMVEVHADSPIPGMDVTSLSRAERGFRNLSEGQERAIREAIARLIARRQEQKT